MGPNRRATWPRPKSQDKCAGIPPVLPATLCERIEDADGGHVFRQACVMGLEGIVAKRRDSRRPLTRAWTSGRAVLDREPVHVDDILAEEDEFPEGYAMSRRIGQRTTFSVPLLRGTEAIGCFFSAVPKSGPSAPSKSSWPARSQTLAYAEERRRVPLIRPKGAFARVAMTNAWSTSLTFGRSRLFSMAIPVLSN